MTRNPDEATSPDESGIGVEQPDHDSREPRQPAEDGTEPSAHPGENPDAVTAVDVDSEGPQDADEGDPNTRDYPAESS